MNRHSSEGAPSSVPSRSKNAPTVSPPVSPAITAVPPQSPPQPASEVSVRPPQDQDSAAPPKPPAPPAQCKKLPPQQPEFAPSAKANNGRARLTNPRPNAPPAPAIPDNKSTRTSKSRMPRGSLATPPALAPTTFPASNHSRIRCAPHG